MAYKTLYRSYRPQTFDEVVGQEHIITTLRHAVEENKIAHAYLFCGPRGTGKTTIAKLLAKAINCTGNPKPCDHCENCQSIALGSHPDVIEIDAASNNGVDEVRNLIDKVKYSPSQGKYKVYIIDEVHMMSQGAFNALLKTLEEPPAHVVFILATTEPHKILPTIISRCQRFDFQKISLQDIVARMKTVITEEHYQCDDDALEMIAKLADGGMRDALSILEQCLAYNDQHLTVNDVNHIYGIVSLDHKIELLKVLLAKDLKKALMILEQMKSNGIDIQRLTVDLVDILKDIVIYRNTKDDSILFVLSSYYLEQIVPYITCDDAFYFIDVFMDALEKYTKVVNPSIYFELCLLKICNHESQHEVHIVPMPTQLSDDTYEDSVSEEIVQDSIQSEPNVEEIYENPIPVQEMEPEFIPDPLGQDVVNEEPYEEQPEIHQSEDIIEDSQDSVDEDLPHFEFEQQDHINENINNDIYVAEDDILNILVQAKREILNDIQERWPIIKRYLANLNTAKCASMLCDATPVAACDGGLIISFDYQPAVNNVNYYKNYKQLHDFLQEILGKDFEFIAMRLDSWLELRKKFIVLKKQNALPSPHSITLQHIQAHSEDDHVELRDSQAYALELFGDLVEFKEDK